MAENSCLSYEVLMSLCGLFTYIYVDIHLLSCMSRNRGVGVLFGHNRPGRTSGCGGQFENEVVLPVLGRLQTEGRSSKTARQAL